MKSKLIQKTIMITGYWLLVTGFIHAQGVAINTTGNPANSSSLLDVDAAGMTPTKAGLLISRMTTAERNAIPSPAESLLIYNTDTKCFEGYNSTSSTWVAFGCIGCTVPTAVTASASPEFTCSERSRTIEGNDNK